ncbi:MAG: hypothetical protein HAW67_03185, partial [Endozoicomonadaceae bacterium]|nr:hypothetical protein [Endozoicomonadaceae bacterium]
MKQTSGITSQQTGITLQQTTRLPVSPASFPSSVKSMNLESHMPVEEDYCPPAAKKICLDNKTPIPIKEKLKQASRQVWSSARKTLMLSDPMQFVKQVISPVSAPIKESAASISGNGSLTGKALSVSQLLLTTLTAGYTGQCLAKNSSAATVLGGSVCVFALTNKILSKLKLLVSLDDRLDSTNQKRMTESFARMFNDSCLTNMFSVELIKNGKNLTQDQEQQYTQIQSRLEAMDKKLEALKKILVHNQIDISEIDGQLSDKSLSKIDQLSIKEKVYPKAILDLCLSEIQKATSRNQELITSLLSVLENYNLEISEVKKSVDSLFHSLLAESGDVALSAEPIKISFDVHAERDRLFIESQYLEGVKNVIGTLSDEKQARFDEIQESRAALIDIDQSLIDTLIKTNGMIGDIRSINLVDVLESEISMLQIQLDKKCATRDTLEQQILKDQEINNSFLTEVNAEILLIRDKISQCKEKIEHIKENKSLEQDAEYMLLNSEVHAAEDSIRFLENELNDYYLLTQDVMEKISSHEQIKRNPDISTDIKEYGLIEISKLEEKQSLLKEKIKKLKEKLQSTKKSHVELLEKQTVMRKTALEKQATLRKGTEQEKRLAKIGQSLSLLQTVMSEGGDDRKHVEELLKKTGFIISSKQDQVNHSAIRVSQDQVNHSAIRVSQDQVNHPPIVP